jgi:hypothetical protein
VKRDVHVGAKHDLRSNKVKNKNDGNNKVYIILSKCFAVNVV